MGRHPITLNVIESRLEGRNIEIVDYGGRVLDETVFRCVTCDHHWSTKAAYVLKGSGCRKCASFGRKPLPVTEILKKLEGRDIRLVEYAGTVNGESVFECTKCSNSWTTRASSVTRGRGCGRCAGVAPISLEALERDLADRPVSVVEYSGSTTGSSLWRCDEGHEWRAEARNVRRGSGCPECARLRRRKANKLEERKAGLP